MLRKKHKLNYKGEMKTNNAKIIELNNLKPDFSKLFPFDDKDKIDKDNSTLGLLKNKITNYIENVKLRHKGYEDRIKIYFPFRLQIVTLNRLITGSRKSFASLDSLVALQDNYYSFTTNRKQTFENEAQKVVSLSKKLKDNGIKFCSVTYPSKFSKFKPDFPQGIVDYSNYNVDTYLNVLKSNNINCLDLRENANQQFKNHLPLFFKSDHHWKPETAFWATSEILKYLNSKLDMNFNCFLLNKDNFNFTTYPKMFLGSHGKKVTLALAEPDDITIFEPNFPTEFETSDLVRQKLKIGSFSDVLLDYKTFYYAINNPYEGDAYSVYGCDNYIKNLSPKVKYKVLVIHDSFSVPVIPLLAIVSKEVIRIDLRASNKFSVEKYILDLKPDVVILAYATDRFNWDRDPQHMENMFKFH